MRNREFDARSPERTDRAHAEGDYRICYAAHFEKGEYATTDRRSKTAVLQGFSGMAEG
jgi:hypothetical protein